MRQPLERAATGDREPLLLPRWLSGAAIVLGGGRRGEQRVRAFADLDADRDAVAADQPAGWVQQGDVRDVAAFG